MIEYGSHSMHHRLNKKFKRHTHGTVVRSRRLVPKSVVESAGASTLIVSFFVGSTMAGMARKRTRNRLENLDPERKRERE